MPPGKSAPSRAWRLLDRLADMFSGHGGGLTTGAVTALADRVTSALTSQRAEDAKVGARELQAAFQSALARAPEEARKVITSPHAAPAGLSAAFSLGQLNFAGALLARAVERRADERFEAMLGHPNYRPIILALAARPSNGIELAAATGLAEETVSRKLRDLREVGISDFRREGVQLINFLSPAAVAMLGPHVPAAMRSEATEALEDLKDGLSPALQTTPVFSRNPGRARGRTVTASEQPVQ